MADETASSRRRVREYRIQSVLGSGGFGKVYLARDLLAGGIERYVALKLLRMDAPRPYQERFRDEATILSLLDHPSFVKVHALFRLEGQWCIDMEYVRGITLQRLLNRVGALPARAALEIALQVAEALDLAWNHPGPGGEPLRVQHRDIKPSNLILTRSGIVKVLDFGLARWEATARASTTTESKLPASIGYMAPERFGFKADFGPEADVYALGVVLWELLVGEPFLPSGGISMDLTMDPDEFLPLMTRLGLRLRSATSPAVAELVSAMLAYKASDRPPAAEVVEAILHLLSQEAEVDAWRRWVREVLVPEVEHAHRGVELDVLCGREVSTDPIALGPSSGPDADTWLPLTGVTGERHRPRSAPTPTPPAPTAPLPRPGSSRTWIAVIAVVGALGTVVLGSAMRDRDDDGSMAWADCDDLDPHRRPGAEETCDGHDEDCDGQIDEGLEQHTLYTDRDGDGVGAGDGVQTCQAAREGYASASGDCDDANPDVRPGATEIPDNRRDDDCDPTTPDHRRAEGSTPSATGRVLLLGDGVEVTLMDAESGSAVPLKGGGTRNVRAGAWRAVMSQAGVTVSQNVTVEAGRQLTIDCSTPAMGKLCRFVSGP